MNKNTNLAKDIVLVVDDTAANHEVIREFLRVIDVPCESAFDGMEAITLCNSLAKDYYSLILMDINLPHMNGFETAERLRGMGIKAPIIAVTATDKKDAGLISARDRFDHLLHKPFNSAEFFTAISPFIKNAGHHPLKTDSMAKDEQKAPSIDTQVCDVHKAINNMGNNLKLFTKHFNNFKRNHVDLVLRMASLIDRKEYAECAMLCHSIKGLSGMLELTRLYEHITQMEKILQKIDGTKDYSAVKDIDDLLVHIGTDIRLVCQVQI